MSVEHDGAIELGIEELEHRLAGWFLPQYYGWFLISIIGVFAMNCVQISMVYNARKKFGVQAPNLYAPHGHKFAEQFNCIQRAHQNTLEVLPLTLIFAIITAFFHPILTASFLTTFSIGRIIYAFGYSKRSENRKAGFMIATFGGTVPIVGLAAYEGLNMVIGW